LTRWGSLVRTQYRAPFFLATLGTPQLNPQDARIIDEIWSHNLSLVQIWESYKLVHLQASISLEEAIRRYTGWLRDNNRSPRYIQEIRWVLEELRGHIGDHLTVAQHTTFLVVGALKKCRSAGTKKIRYQSFYSWLYDQQLIPQPLNFKSIQTRTSRTNPEILTNQQVASLIHHCPDNLRSYIWLCLCMGLRVSEANRTQHITHRGGFLIIGEEAAVKTRTRRVCEVLPGHEQYLPSIQRQRNLRNRLNQLRDESGIARWHRNVMRHTAASHWLNHYQDEAKAALHLGHSPTMLHRHYKALVTRKESEEFFKLWD